MNKKLERRVVKQMPDIPKMRTAESALSDIKIADPSTNITLRCIRRIVASGAIPILHVGKKKLFNLDDFILGLDF